MSTRSTGSGGAVVGRTEAVPGAVGVGIRNASHEVPTVHAYAIGVEEADMLAQREFVAHAGMIDEWVTIRPIRSFADWRPIERIVDEHDESVAHRSGCSFGEWIS